ncbi:hypothetical protein ACM46_09580 [Chryseobacterium angstadtii]|uniref:Uncharacterized protein n=1 Tax=Chryseobacterium angstadtii TaxID=558151 RepID=A0A0J7L5Z1_9FLAO|nr:hypothetical protein [Chryseobacterium angstadtii]KMQ64505.1 hypothetical protein ACM46_09580 [Chryseobacterium angstadtii]
MKSIKNISIATALIVFNSLCAQVAIEKETIDGNSTILDFNNTSGNTKGLILPAVQVAPAGSPANGTFVFDRSDDKIKMYENNTWKSLSDAGNSSAVIANSSDETGNGVVIGTQAGSAEGVLVLESEDKAMILPKISSPHLNVKNPYPGMVCYDTASKTFAVFDGTLWNYWK